jgi:hypothetical protein
MWVVDSVCVTAPATCNASQHISAAASKSFMPAAGACPADDGSSGAPSGAAPYPRALAGYAKTIHERGCKVAGMDYNVGATGALLAHTGQAISGWAYTPGANASLTTTADNPATLQNWDFSAIDNFQIRVQNANVTISNVYLKVINTSGNAREPLKLLGGANNVTVTKNHHRRQWSCA